MSVIKSFPTSGLTERNTQTIAEAIRSLYVSDTDFTDIFDVHEIEPYTDDDSGQSGYLFYILRKDGVVYRTGRQYIKIYIENNRYFISDFGYGTSMSLGFDINENITCYTIKNNSGIGFMIGDQIFDYFEATESIDDSDNTIPILFRAHTSTTSSKLFTVFSAYTPDSSQSLDDGFID